MAQSLPLSRSFFVSNAASNSPLSYCEREKQTASPQTVPDQSQTRYCRSWFSSPLKLKESRSPQDKGVGHFGAGCIARRQQGFRQLGFSTGTARGVFSSATPCMAWYRSNDQLVQHLQRIGVCSSPRVIRVLQEVDRGLFVPKDASPYQDSPQPIGYNATISAPHMHAHCLELLESHLQPGHRVLDVGSGTGFLTACFAKLVGPQGKAVGVEHIPELVESSKRDVRRSQARDLLESGALELHCGDGRQGWPEAAPYDAIHVGAAAPELPTPLLEQLKPGGRMVVPVGEFFQDLRVVDKGADGSLAQMSAADVRYVPLTERKRQLQ